MRLKRVCAGQTGGTLYKNGVGEREKFHHQTFSKENFQIKAEILQYCQKKGIAHRQGFHKGWKKAPFKGAFQ